MILLEDSTEPGSSDVVHVTRHVTAKRLSLKRVKTTKSVVVSLETKDEEVPQVQFIDWMNKFLLEPKAAPRRRETTLAAKARKKPWKFWRNLWRL